MTGQTDICGLNYVTTDFEYIPNINMKRLSKSDMMNLIIIWNVNNGFRCKEGDPAVLVENTMKVIRPVKVQLLLYQL